MSDASVTDNTGLAAIDAVDGLAALAPWLKGEGARLYVQPLDLQPLDLLVGQGRAMPVQPLAGTGIGFSRCRVIARNGRESAATIAPTGEIAAWAASLPSSLGRGVAESLAHLTSSPPAAALFPSRPPLLMGVVNVTPDSFSDGGAFLDPEAAIAHGAALLSAGAGILDIGGESTRPGAAPVPADEQCRRILPVISGLAASGVPLSVDTRDGTVMAASCAAGARIINDVSALTHDPRALAVAADSGAAVILMHMQGTPATMQQAPAYACAPLDVYDALAARIAACVAAGIDRERLLVDPGIGFGKSLSHNLDILRALGLFHGLGCPVVLGVSRKSFIGKLMRQTGEGAIEAGGDPGSRLPGSLAAALWGATQGIQVLRVHDVAETRQALHVHGALVSSL